MKTALLLLALSTPMLATVAAAADSKPSSSTPMPTVSGTVHFGPQKAKMSHLYLRRKTNDGEPVTALLFSDNPLPERALDDRQKLTQLAKKRAFVGLYAEIDASGSLGQTELFYDDGAFTGSWKYESANGTSVTSGKIGMEEEREFFGKPYAVNVAFKLGGAPTETWTGSSFYHAKPTGLAVGRAEGWMVRQGKKTEFIHAVGLAETDLFGDSGERSVLLTTKPVPDEMFAARMGPERELHKAGIAFLRARIDANGEIMSLSAPSDEGHAMSFSSNQWSAEFAAAPAGEIDGSMETAEEKNEISEYPRFKIRFHAAIRTVGAAAPVTAKNGKALPKDGGEPGKAYRDFATALKNAKTIEELLPLRSKTVAKEADAVPPEHRTAFLRFLKESAGTPMKVVGGFANDKQATLWLEGKQHGEDALGRVNVHFEDGVWKLGSESIRMGGLASK